MFDWGSLEEWLGGLDPKTRIAIIALCHELSCRSDWIVRIEEYGNPHELLGRLEGLAGILLEERGAVTAVSRSGEALDVLVSAMTHLEPLPRMRLNWEMARMLPDTPPGERPTSLLDAALNDKQASGREQELMRRYLRLTVGLVARTRLTMDLLARERLDRVEASLASAIGHQEEGRAGAAGSA